MDYVVVAELEALPDSVEAFRTALLQHAANSTSLEPGCFVFDVCQNPQDRQRFLLFEVYRDLAAYEQHREMPSYKNFMSSMKPHFKFVARTVLDRLEKPQGVSA